MREISIHTNTTEHSGIVMEEGEIREYVMERPGDSILTGSIFLGKVTNVDRGLQAAFIDIGLDQAAFLRNESIPWSEGGIQQSVKEGESIFLQVVKEPLGNKGPQVTADLTLPGSFAVYQPFGKRVSVSKRIEDARAEEYRDMLQRHLEDEDGCIVRTSAAIVSMDELAEEIAHLRQRWKQMFEGNRNGRPKIIWEDRIIPDQLIRKYPLESITSIIVDEVETSRYIKETFPALSERVVWEKNPRVNINGLQKELIHPIIEVEGGAQLVIDRTEAMTIIDVNSYKYKGKTLSHQQAYEINCRAAEAVQKQIRLRNLSGMILIDFISMNDKRSQERLVQYMRKLMKNDPVKSKVLGMTRLGILEMTRKREWTEPSRYLAKERKLEFNVQSHVYQLERELLSKNRNNAEAILVAVNPDIYDLKKRLLSERISSKIPQELFVRQDDSIPAFQIELEGSEDMVHEAIERRGYHVDNLF
ncbi:ribonuclease E/G [Halobacillus yeomjeoni]|uniref:ribonuclease E/G n=1 Tax=Halobacillus yeomjeoni TaxID=311194 RepID=UPI001CD3B1DD|nr:ribonuclease E/G [Halobacillus yeomjeoni]MCA0982612.1 ribonuclease E/G [Halobacillus yeomjeoni]